MSILDLYITDFHNKSDNFIMRTNEFFASKTGSKPSPSPRSFSTDRFKVVPILECFLSLCQRFYMCRLVCYCLFLICPSFGTSGRLCFVIVAFPGYRHIRFSTYFSVTL